MNISIGTAARLSGLDRSSVYKMVKKKTIPYLVETAFGRRSYLIPLAAFRLWMEKELERLEKKTHILKHSLKQIKERLNHE